VLAADDDDGAAAETIEGYRDEARRLRWILSDLLEGDAPAGEIRIGV
jgi:hypothetical protein